MKMYSFGIGHCSYRVMIDTEFNAHNIHNKARFKRNEKINSCIFGMYANSQTMTVKLNNEWKQNCKRHQVKHNRNSTNHDISHIPHSTIPSRPFGLLSELLIFWDFVYLLDLCIKIISFPSSMLQAHFDCFRFNVTCKYLLQNFICMKIFLFPWTFSILSDFCVRNFNIVLCVEMSNYWMCALMRSDLKKKVSKSQCERSGVFMWNSQSDWYFRYRF